MTRILAVCAAAVLAFTALVGCTYHDATYHDGCDPNATTIVACTAP